MEDLKEVVIRMWRLQGAGPRGMFLYFDPETEAVKLYNLPFVEVEVLDDSSFFLDKESVVLDNKKCDSVSAVAAGGRAVSEPDWIKDQFGLPMED